MYEQLTFIEPPKMRHRMGNTPKCIECYYWQEKSAEDKCRDDGWCTNPKQLELGINSHKREHPPDREARRWADCCRMWEDAYTRLTHFEVCTRTPEEWRKPEEKEMIRRLLR